ncbi:acyl-CoA thioesterase [Thermosulfurimonas marina]|uniref:Acyl-CoA thioesterase n=1 Tax=Thermosulfurimonas marina TaxID=2047767 RepID=A0A6H1WT06_9BACT|nr:thioesterase family protein [Thermosulfurimonas marina]QJA06256.1 acyl-CoA thioesterase [Thermosulfurimonas marina]
MRIWYRVIYGDTDCGGVMYYGNYLRLFEIGRTELLRAAGITYRQIEEERGLILPVVEVQVRYKAPARYDDLLALETRLSEVRPHRVRFDYRVASEEGRTLATGYTVHAPVNRQGRLTRFPQDLLVCLEKLCR